MPKKGEFDPNASEDSIRQRKFNSKPEEKKRRADRNHSRAIMAAEGKVSKGDGKDVDHKNHDTSDKRKSNLSVMKAGLNRSKNQHDTR
jgi:hypothetical protein